MNNEYGGFPAPSEFLEEEKRSDRHTVYRRFSFASFLFIVSFLLILFYLSSDAFAVIYSEFSKNASAFIGTFFGLFSFSFAEILFYAFIVFCFLYLISFVRRLLFKKHRIMTVIHFISLIYLMFSLLFFLFISLWGLNYLSAPLSARLRLTVKNTSAGELENAALTSLNYANLYAGKASRDQSGSLSFGSFSDMAYNARSVEIGLMRRFKSFKAPYCPIPKAVMSSKIMSYFGITGIYSPLTGESNVNTDYVVSQMPFVMTHELSHRLGVAPEDEANFAAFLACTGSSDPDFIYSGYLNAYIYSINQVFELSPETAKGIIQKQSAAVSADLLELSKYNQKYEGPVNDFGNSVNNTYLKSMGETDGVKSYGRMVDLLIAYYNSSLFTDSIPR